MTHRERESDLKCEAYLELAGRLFPFSFIMEVFIRVVPSFSFSEGILQFFPFFSTVAYPLQFYSASRVGWFIFLPEYKETSTDFPRMSS